MHPEFMYRLDALRATFGQPLMVTSGYRTAAHNASLKNSSPKSAHLIGRAVDIYAVPGKRMPDLIALARQLGFTGFGILSPSALHLDDLDGSDRQRPAMWGYT